MTTPSYKEDWKSSCLILVEMCPDKNWGFVIKENRKILDTQ